MYKFKPMKIKKPAGRPNVYPDAREIAKKIIKIDKSFICSSWEASESHRFVILHGLYRFRDGIKDLELVPFCIYIPKRSLDPYSGIKVKFQYDTDRTGRWRIKYLQEKYQLREWIFGLLYEELTNQ